MTLRGILFAAFCLLALLLPAQEREHIEDSKFARGLAMSPLTPHEVISGGGFEKTNPDTLHFPRPSEEKPAWQACQWHSRHNIAHTQMTRTRHGRTYCNAGKRISLSRKGVLTLEILTSQEYSAPRKNGEQWPHLLIQQDFRPTIPLENVGRMVVSFDLRLLYCRQMMKPDEFDPSLHTAHTPFYLSLRNVNPKSADHGNSLWMGIQSFDYRYEQLSDKHEVSWDIGTARYIYQMPPRLLWGDIRFTDHRWHRLEADIMPHLRNAVSNLQERGLFKDTRLEDFAVEGMNFGWEVPGTFDAAIQVKDFSLKTTAR